MIQEEVQVFRGLERRRMIQVKDVLAGALIRSGQGDTDTAFICACVDYLAFIMGRFIAQGTDNLHRVDAAVPSHDKQGQQIVTDIRATLKKTADLVESLTEQAGACRSAPVNDSSGVLRAARTFVDYYNGTLARRKDPAQYIIKKYFNEQDYWRATNDVTSDVINQEAALYQALQRALPTGIQLADS